MRIIDIPTHDIEQDADLPDELRTEAAEKLEPLFADPDVLRYVEGVLYAKSLPASADPRAGLDLARGAALH